MVSGGRAEDVVEFGLRISNFGNVKLGVHDRNPTVHCGLHEGWRLDANMMNRISADGFIEPSVDMAEYRTV